MNNKKSQLLIEGLNKAPKEGLIVEIGCIREDHEVVEDGYSTYYIAKWCQENNRTFISCDIEEPTVHIANSVLERENLPRCVLLSDGKRLLKELEQPIAFLFLDSHRHPAFSLDQYKEALLLPQSVVIIDDAQAIDGFPFGKAQFIKDFFDYHKIQYKIIETHRNPAYQWRSLITISPGKQKGKMK